MFRTKEAVGLGLDGQAALINQVQRAGTVQLWEWISDGATTFSH
jgi:hypothetical protein